MKKALFVLLAFLVLFSFVSCAEEPKHEHSLTHHDADPATCTENGTIEYWSCSCGKNYSDASGNIEIANIVETKKGHGTAKADTAMYCSDGLYDVCSICGSKLEVKSSLVKTTLKKLIISDSVTSIGASAFRDYTAMESVTIPSSVKSIGVYAFWKCTSLETVTIPSSVSTVNNYAFEGCTNLTSVTISSGVTYLGVSAFLNCTGLKTVNFPSTVTTIYTSLFYGCTSLETINFGGTKAEWKALADTAGTDWKKNVPATCQVKCSDGTVDIDGNALPE